MSEAPASAAGLLRELRERQGQSLRWAAGELGLAPSSLSRLERGERSPSVELAAKIADHYGVAQEMLSIADGRLPHDLREILVRHPEEIDRLRALYAQELNA